MSPSQPVGGPQGILAERSKCAVQYFHQQFKTELEKQAYQICGYCKVVSECDKDRTRDKIS